MNLPTKITVTRIVCTVLMIVTLFILYLCGDKISTPTLGNSKINLIFLIIFVFFLIASYTDHLDGKLARKNNQVTSLGKFLDPVADKLLVSSMMLFLTAPGILAPYAVEQNVNISIWCVIIMIVRDVAIDAIRQIAAAKGAVIAANKVGKLKTVLQMVAISAVLLNDFPFHYIYGNIDPRLTVSSFLVYLATAVSVISLVFYIVQNRKVLVDKK